MAFASLREHKVRSLLTVFGVVIGVTALVVVSSILVGVDKDMREYLTITALKHSSSLNGILEFTSVA